MKVMLWLLIPALLFASSVPVVLFMKFRSQRSHDGDRKSYLLTFPSDLAEDRVKAWLSSISGILQIGVGRVTGVPTIVFETWASARGIVHRMQVPRSEADYVASQMRTLIPGLTVVEDTTRPKDIWTYVLEVGMSSPSRQLRIANSKDLSHSLLASVQALGPDETIVMQWILTPAMHEPLPSKERNANSHDFKVMRSLSGPQIAQNDEIEDRRRKLSEHNLLALGRIGAIAKTESDAKHLAQRVVKALAGAHSHANRFKTRGADRLKASFQLNAASSPMRFPAQFGISELVGILAWPIGQPFVSGLPRGSSRQLQTTDDIAREGILLGSSNFSGDERPIAIDHTRLNEHIYIGGKSGTGKSTYLGGLFYQAVNQGLGAIVLDASNSESNESIFSRALDLIPDDRLDDVIIMDVNHDRERPVGFNILDQGDPRIVVDQITDLFAFLYSDTSGVWTRQLLFHTLYTLAEHPGHSFVDITTMLTPRTPDEIAWADDLIRSVKDPEIRLFWQRWQNFSQVERDRYTQPLMNRAWQLISRPESRNIIGQTNSSFKWTDALTSNKIVLISLSGLPTETANLLASLLLNSLWTAAQKLSPDKSNLLILDEFQLTLRIPTGLEDMLRRARKHHLAIALATQYMENLPSEIRTAVTNGTGTQIIFESSSAEARHWRNEFSGNHLTEDDFKGSRKYEAVAQIATETGTSAPVTLKVIPPFPATSNARVARQNSAEQYGRPIADVQSEMTARRTAPQTPTGKRLPIGIKEWDE